MIKVQSCHTFQAMKVPLSLHARRQLGNTRYRYRYAVLLQKGRICTQLQQATFIPYRYHTRKVFLRKNKTPQIQNFMLSTKYIFFHWTNKRGKVPLSLHARRQLGNTMYRYRYDMRCCSKKEEFVLNCNKPPSYRTGIIPERYFSEKSKTPQIQNFMLSTKYIFFHWTNKRGLKGFVS